MSTRNHINRIGVVRGRLDATAVLKTHERGENANQWLYSAGESGGMKTRWCCRTPTVWVRMSEGTHRREERLFYMEEMWETSFLLHATVQFCNIRPGVNLAGSWTFGNYSTHVNKTNQMVLWNDITPCKWSWGTVRVRCYHFFHLNIWYLAVILKTITKREKTNCLQTARSGFWNIIWQQSIEQIYSNYNNNSSGPCSLGFPFFPVEWNDPWRFCSPPPPKKRRRRENSLFLLFFWRTAPFYFYFKLWNTSGNITGH